jgi:hypothetical protein
MRKRRKLRQLQKITKILEKEVRKIKKNFKMSPAKLRPRSRREKKWRC